MDISVYLSVRSVREVRSLLDIQYDNPDSAMVPQ
jgi:hypothetical protein